MTLRDKLRLYAYKTASDGNATGLSVAIVAFSIVCTLLLSAACTDPTARMVLGGVVATVFTLWFLVLTVRAVIVRLANEHEAKMKLARAAGVVHWHE